MPIRCRNFDDDGQPVGKRGCTKGPGCSFIHPDSPVWAQATRRQNSDFSSNRSSGPSHSRGNSGKGSWGGPPAKPPSKDWDTSLWGSPSKKRDDSSTASKWGSTGHSSARKAATSESPTSSVSNDWNTTSDKGETSKLSTEGDIGENWSWGTDTTSGWGVEKNVGWGSSGGQGWGSPGGQRWGVDEPGGWNISASEGRSVEGTSDSTSAGQNSRDQKGKGKGRQGEDVEMRDASPVGSFKPGHSKSAVLPPPPARNTPPPSTVEPKPIRPLPLPLPLRQKKPQPLEDGSLIKQALQCLKRSGNEAEQVLVKPPETQVQVKPAPLSTKTAHGPKGRADLFSQVIKHTSSVVLLQLESQRAQHDLARWKRTQESAQYERASPASRVILDHHRAQLNFRVQEAKRRLDKALTALAELPDFASRKHETPGPILTKQTIIAYTAELRDWFSDLQLHKRILVEKAAAQTDLLLTPVQRESTTPVEPQLTARQLVERGNWSWSDIRSATNELDTRVLATAEHLYSNAYTTIADLKDQVAGLQDPRQINPTASRGNQSSTLSSTTDLVGENISTQATRAAELISRVHVLEQEREHLESEIRAMNKLCTEAEAHFSQFEQWRQDDGAKIQEMTEQLRNLHLRRKTPSATMQPAQLDGILLQMRPIIIGHLQREVQPIFDALRSRCLENHEGMKGVIEEMVTPALVMTDDICHRVSTMSFDVASDT